MQSYLVWGMTYMNCVCLNKENLSVKVWTRRFQWWENLVLWTSKGEPFFFLSFMTNQLGFQNHQQVKQTKKKKQKNIENENMKWPTNISNKMYVVDVTFHKICICYLMNVNLLKGDFMHEHDERTFKMKNKLYENRIWKYMSKTFPIHLWFQATQINYWNI